MTPRDFLAAPRDETLPSILVVIPAYNEERHIGRCLSAVVNLDYPRSFWEAVVVDNGSTDATQEIATQFGVPLMELTDGFVGAVRNHGATFNASDVLAFLDADCVPPADWLRQGAHALRANEDVGAVGGVCMAPDNGTWLERTWAQEVADNCERISSLAASSMFLWRDDFVRVGGFNESMTAGEDDDLSNKLKTIGLELVSCPGCAVYHLGWPKSYGEVFNRQRWQGASQLKAASGLRDRNLIAVHIYLIALAATPVLLIKSDWTGPFWALPFVPLLLIPALAAWRRVANARGRLHKLAKGIKVYFIFQVYYWGRVVGLLSAYKQLLLGHSAGASKTWKRQPSVKGD